MVRPGVPAPSLAPLVGKDVVRERGGVRYHVLEARSLVGRCASPNVPFDWTANPYRGCAMGCRYCYAAYTHGYLGKDGASEFHSVVYVKTGGEDETRRRLRAAAGRGELVALGTATDPYQPAEQASRVTRRFLEWAAQVRGLRLTLTTKGSLVLRDLDLLRRLHARGTLSVAVSLVSPHAALLRRVEPWAPPPEVRVEVLRRLAAEGIDAGLAIAPVLPGLTDGEEDIDALVRAAAGAGVRRVSWRLLFLRSPTREKYLEWLSREFPRYLPAYERAYGRRSHLAGAYADRMGALVERARARHGLTGETFGRCGDPPVERQLTLWG
ncbi:MAG TPA: radical SAM protein [Vicinamibacteria bacterium]|nr:radical SAM protein [Vicinamibacteria bacterium]